VDIRDLEVYNIDKAASNYPDITIDDAHFDGTVRFDSYPPAQVNEITNAALAIWSGSTRDGVSPAGYPDGWLVLDQTNTGVTLVNSDTVAKAGTGNTVYPGFNHAMEIQTLAATGTSDYISYPGIAGVSTNPIWYKKYAGERVTFGALVRTDIANNVRPYIITCTNARVAGNMHGVTPFATYGSYGDGDAGWDLLTATTTVPNAASALEFGWEIDGTSRTGPTAYVCGPFFVSGATPSMPVQRPGEMIFLEEKLDVWSGGSDFGARAATRTTTLDISSDIGWNGIIPEDAKAIYATVMGDFVATSDYLYFYGDNILGGVTVVPQVVGGVASFDNVWIPVSGTGTITVQNAAAVTGVSLFVHGVQMQ